MTHGDDDALALAGLLLHAPSSMSTRVGLCTALSKVQSMMTDLLPALAEHLATLDEWTIYNVGEGDMTQQELCQALAKKALAVVVERLPTREAVAQILYKANERAVKWPTWVELDAAPRLKDEWLTMADALLRDWRERLGVKG